MKIKQPLKAWLILAPADQVIAEVRKRIRATLGDKLENETEIFARNGFFFVQFPPDAPEDLKTWTRREDNSALAGLRRAKLEAFFKELRKHKRK